MNPQKLFTSSGEFAGVYFCEKCKHLYGDSALDIAERCCICTGCGEPFDRETEYSSGHKSCFYELRAKRERERLDAAELIDCFDGPIYLIEGWGQDGFVFGDVTDVLFECVESPEDWPEFAFCTDEIPFRTVDLSDIVELCTADSYEDAADDLTTPDSLANALDEFNEANKRLVSYEPDWKRKVRLPPIPEDFRKELIEAQDS